MNKEIINLITFKEKDKISKVINVFNKTAPYTDSKGFGVVVNNSNKCIGVITDGDIRRVLNKKKQDIVKKVYNNKFSFAKKTQSKTAILQIFEKLIKEKNYHLSLPVLDNNKKVFDIINYNNFLLEERHPKCIRVKIPARVSFVGGGTDFSEYLNKNKSYILSAAIQKFLTVSLYPRKDEKITINNYSNNKSFNFKNFNLLKNYKKTI